MLTIGFPVYLIYYLSRRSVAWNPEYFETWCIFLHKFLLRRLNKERVLMINYLSQVDLVKFWQILYLFLIFAFRDKTVIGFKYENTNSWSASQISHILWDNHNNDFARFSHFAVTSLVWMLVKQVAKYENS